MKCVEEKNWGSSFVPKGAEEYIFFCVKMFLILSVPFFDAFGSARDRPIILSDCSNEGSLALFQFSGQFKG